MVWYGEDEVEGENGLSSPVCKTGCRETPTLQTTLLLFFPRFCSHIAHSKSYYINVQNLC